MARTHRRDFDLHSKKENRDFFWLPLEARRVRNAKRMVYPDEKSNCTTTRRLLSAHPFQPRMGCGKTSGWFLPLGGKVKLFCNPRVI